MVNFALYGVGFYFLGLFAILPGMMAGKMLAERGKAQIQAHVWIVIVGAAVFYVLSRGDMSMGL